MVPAAEGDPDVATTYSAMYAGFAPAFDVSGLLLPLASIVNGSTCVRRALVAVRLLPVLFEATKPRAIS